MYSVGFSGNEQKWYHQTQKPRFMKLVLNYDSGIVQKYYHEICIVKFLNQNPTQVLLPNTTCVYKTCVGF